jgi:hypothetical protein
MRGIEASMKHAVAFEVDASGKKRVLERLP